MMTISGIKNNVQQLLLSTDSFVTVIAAPPTEANNFQGYPSSSHYYAGTQSDYATVSQNRRVIDYVVELYLVTNKITSEETKYSEAYALIDSIINLFDQSIDLSSTALGLSRACDIMRPAPGALEAIMTDKGPGLMVTIHLYCEADASFLN